MRNPFKKPPKRIVVFHHVQMDQSIEGIWDGMVDDHYVVLNPTLIMPANQRSKLQGDLLIPRQKVAFLQVLATDASK